MQNKILKNETGRSMVEMLGVLAVMGLLTIIGIAGFRVAMNKHYANQTVQRLMKRAVVVAGQANFGQTLSLREFDSNDGEYPIPNPETLEHNAESFTLTVNEVPQEVCQQIVGMEWKIAKIIPEDCSDTTMKFMFLNDLTDCSTCQPETFPCEDYGTECGKCSPVKGFADNNDECEGNENGQYCVKGKCVSCANGYFGNPISCSVCNEDSSWTASAEVYRMNCLGTMFYQPGYSNMIGCKHSDHHYQTDEVSCKACENRCFLATDNNACHWGDGRTGRIRNKDGSCSGCITGWYQRNTTCRQCNENAGYGSVVAADKHNCLRTMFYQPGYSNIIGCKHSDHHYQTDEVSCKECQNRCFLASDNNACHWGDGRTGYIRDATGNCVPAQ